MGVNTFSSGPCARCCDGWADERVEDRILEVLGEVREGVQGYHFGPPFVTAYQLAIALDRRYPQIREALGMDLGGEGIGERNSFA